MKICLSSFFIVLANFCCLAQGEVLTVFSARPENTTETTNFVIQCDGENQFSYQIKPIGASSISNKLKSVELSLPDGLEFVTSSVTIDELNHLNIQPINKKILIPESLLANFSASNSNGITISFKARVNGLFNQTSDNFIPILINYTYGGAEKVLNLTSKKETNENTFEVKFPKVKVDFVDEVPPNLRPLKNYTIKMKITNDGTTKLNKFWFKLYPLVVGQFGQDNRQFFSIKSITGPNGVTISEIENDRNISNTHAIEIANGLPVNNNINKDHTFDIDVTFQTTECLNSFQPIIAEAITDCGNVSQDNINLKDNITKNFQFTNVEPYVTSTLPSPTPQLTSQNQTTFFSLENTAAEFGIARNFEVYVANDIEVVEAYYVKNGTEEYKISVVGSNQKLDFASLGNNNPLAEIDGGSIKTDFLPGLVINLKLVYKFKCSDLNKRKAIILYPRYTTLCNKNKQNELTLFNLSIENSTTIVQGSTDYEYDKPTLLGFTSTGFARANIAGGTLKARITVPTGFDLVGDFTDGVKTKGGPITTNAGVEYDLELKPSGYGNQEFTFGEFGNSVNVVANWKNTSKCTIFSDAVIKYDLYLSSSVGQCDISLGRTEESIFLVGDEVACKADGGTPSFPSIGGSGIGFGDPSNSTIDGTASCNIRTTELLVSRSTYGYISQNNQSVYNGVLSALTPYTENTSAALNKQAAMENDQIKVKAIASVIGNSCANKPIFLKVKYLYENVAIDLPLNFDGVRSATLLVKSGEDVKGTYTISSDKIQIAKNQGTREVEITISLPSIPTLMENDKLETIFNLKVQRSFATLESAYISKGFRAVYYQSNAATAINRGARLNLYKFNEQLDEYSWFTNTSCENDVLGYQIVLFQNAVSNPFLNEFRPLIKFSKLNFSQPVLNFISGKTPIGNGNYPFDVGIGLENLNKPVNLYFGTSFSNLVITNTFQNTSCDNSNSLLSGNEIFYDYENILDKSVTTRRDIVHTGYNIPIGRGIPSASQLFVEGYSNVASWQIKVESNAYNYGSLPQNEIDNTLDLYMQWKPKKLGSNIRLVSYTINNSTYVVTNSRAPIKIQNLGNSYYKDIKLNISYSNCKDGETESVDVGFKAVCKGLPLSCSTTPFSNNIELVIAFRNSNMVMSSLPINAEFVKGEGSGCSNYKLPSTITSLDRADVNSVHFGIQVPDGLLFNQTASSLLFAGTPYSLPSLTIDSNYDIYFRDLNFKVEKLFAWKLEDVIPGKTFLKGNGASIGANEKLELSYDFSATCGEGPNYLYDPESPITVYAYAKKNCANSNSILYSSNFKVVPAGYISPSNTATLSFPAISNFVNCSFSTKGAITVSSTDAERDFVLEVELPEGVSIKVPESTSPASAIPEFFTQPGNTRKVFWHFTNQQSNPQTYPFEITLDTKPAVGTRIPIVARLRKAVTVNLCNDNATCSKVYGLVGSALTQSPRVQVSCGLVGTTQLCSTMPSTVDVRYAYVGHVLGNQYTWTFPTQATNIRYATDKSYVDVNYDNISSLNTVIGAVTLTVSDANNQNPINYSLDIKVNQPTVENSRTSIGFELDCPSKPLAVGTSYNLKISGIRTNETVPVEFSGPETFTTSTFGSDINIQFRLPGTYTVTTPDMKNYCATNFGNTFTVEVRKPVLGADQGKLCINTANSQVVLKIEGNEEALPEDYVWFLNGQRLPNVSGSEYIVKKPGRYKVILKNLSCFNTEDDINLHIGMLSPELDRIFHEKRNIEKALPVFTASNNQMFGVKTTNLLTDNSGNANIVYLIIEVGSYICPIIVECSEDNTCEECVNDCLQCFLPDAGAEYVLSGWVQENVALDNLNANVGGLRIDFKKNGVVVQSFQAKAKAYTPAIDGWKKVETNVKVPLAYDEITIALSSSPHFEINYDDIRFHPLDGSLKSFIYDPNSLRLTATLDENNYASFYDYDNEGQLVRVKKETKKGIMTIRESRSNIQNNK